MILRVVLGLWLAASLLYAYYEIRSWSQGPSPLNLSPRQRRVRIGGFVFFVLALGLGIGGTFLHVPIVHNHIVTRAARQAALEQLGYWALTALCVVGLMVMALLSVRESQRELRAAAEEHRRLLDDAFEPVNRHPGDPEPRDRNGHGG